MNRRLFLTDMLKAGVACAVLPSALTYARTWKRTKTIWVMIPDEMQPWPINPKWERAAMAVRFALHEGCWRPVELPITTAINPDYK